MELSVAGGAFLCVAISCAVISGFLTYQEIGQVNRKLSDHEQIAYLFMYPGKMQKITAEYKRLFPAGRVDFWRRAFQSGFFVFLALTAIFSGFFK
jgi:hypothetical protein